ncbi:MAG: hypothetical protein RMY28_009535 [Nostoc sp. ChiSLP01]|nr:hypothetical protein [Nostoc sp. CmiSLP01]MDZ8285203.1 hypothetical protein [Nostoc sp. ChiSLP01]
MTWRQVAPELFHVGENENKTQAVVTLEHLGSDSHPDGNMAQIYVDDRCYVLALREKAETESGFPVVYKFNPTPWWFWEAVQAMKYLPHPDDAKTVVFG